MEGSPLETLCFVGKATLVNILETYCKNDMSDMNMSLHMTRLT